MAYSTAKVWAVVFTCMNLIHIVTAEGDTSNRPNWIILLLVFILTSAIGAVAGIFLLSRKPVIADPPLFKDPMITGELVPTTYRQFPLEYGGGSDDMYPMTTRGQHKHDYSEQIETQEL